jgi:hypothetical protein
VIVLLRLVGILNAAVWFGAAVFFGFGVLPAVFSDQISRPEALGPIWPGVIAMMLFKRYFVLQYFCSIIALVHMFAEWLYLGKPLNRLTAGILTSLFILAFAGGLWLEPRMKLLHEVKYGYGRGATTTEVQRTQAGKSFGALHGISRTLDILALCGLAVYVWRVSSPPNGPRFTPANKFRS